MTTISDISRIGVDLLKLKPIVVQKGVYESFYCSCGGSRSHIYHIANEPRRRTESV